MAVFWLAAIVVFAVIEAFTMGLSSIWFSVGSLAALLSALLGGPLWLQIVWFIVVSAAALYFTRPLARKLVSPLRGRTNADRVLDMTGVVTERIENVPGTGTVTIGGKLWTARSEDGGEIEAGTVVRPVKIEGVKLIVRQEEAAEPAAQDMQQ